MNNPRQRIKLALILTPGIFMLTLWMLVLSSSPLLNSMGVFKLALWALLIAFSAAYSITLFLAEFFGKQGGPRP